MGVRSNTATAIALPAQSVTRIELALDHQAAAWTYFESVDYYECNTFGSLLVTWWIIASTMETHNYFTILTFEKMPIPKDLLRQNKSFTSTKFSFVTRLIFINIFV